MLHLTLQKFTQEDIDKFASLDDSILSTVCFTILTLKKHFMSLIIKAGVLTSSLFNYISFLFFSQMYLSQLIMSALLHPTKLQQKGVLQKM
jgi:hypothetical protein